MMPRNRIGRTHDESWMYESSRSQSHYWTDTVVANKGMWFFDWTKALHTQSDLAHVINIRKLQELFHYTIPYEFFFASGALMSRAEYVLQLQNDPDSSDAQLPGEQFITATLSTELWDGDTWGAGSGEKYPHYPMSLSTTYSYDDDRLKYGQPYVYSISKFEDLGAPGSAGTTTPDAADLPFVDDSGGPFDKDTFGSGTPWATDSYEMFLQHQGDRGTETAFGDPVQWEWARLTGGILEYISWADDTVASVGLRSNSYLRFQNFDVLTADRSQRLEGYASYDSPWVIGRGPRDGYRVLTFEYRDYMDDDVAYYNTWGSYMGGRNQVWAESFDATGADDDLNWTELWSEGATAVEIQKIDDVWTKYVVVIDIQDRTLAALVEFYEYLENVYKMFEEYSERANQICSYNNIVGRFNDFFYGRNIRTLWRCTETVGNSSLCL